MPTDRKLDLLVTITATQATDGTYTANASYAPAGSDPAGAAGVTDANGNINLGNWTNYDHSQYSKSIDFKLLLVGSATVNLPGGGQTVLPVQWSTVYGPACTITGPNLSEMSWSLTDPHTLVIDDNDDDSNDYYYKPAIELQVPGNPYRIEIDPIIKNDPQ